MQIKINNTTKTSPSLLDRKSKIQGKFKENSRKTQGKLKVLKIYYFILICHLI